MRFLPLSIMLLIAGLFITAQAPIPNAHPAQEIEKQRQATAEKEKRLKAEMRALKNKLQGTQDEMVSVASDIQSNERVLFKLEAQIDTKKAEQETLEADLEKDKAALSNLVLALKRIRNIPPEALIARPGTPLKTAQSALLLNSILPSLYGRADIVRANLETLNTLTASLEDDRQQALNTAKKLEGNHKKLSTLMASRKNLYVRTTADHKKQQAELKRISAQATNLRDLVNRIETKQKEEDKARERRAQNASANSAARSIQRTPIPKTGSAQLPVSGIITAKYGSTDEIGATTQGLKITSRPNALIVAPMGGVVDYTGTFKSYGNIVILRHKDSYHSLIAGLDKIDTIVGRAVNAGEPIGKMPDKSANGASDNAQPVLYYELRYKGRPVNPSKKISGLK